MSAHSQQPLLPRRPEQGRALMIVLTIMAILATLAVLFTRGAERLDARWTTELDQSATVQVLISAEGLRDAEVGRAEAILETLIPEARLNRLSKRESRALLDPWLGGTDLPDDLPVPSLIEIRSPAILPVDALARQFEQAGLNTVIDDHSRFSGQLEQTVDRIVWLGLFLIGLALTAAIFVSTFATRAVLMAQRDIIHVLVQVGASDGFVSRLFITRSAKRGAVAAGLGGAVATLIWIVISIGPGRGTIGWSGVGDGISDLIVLALLIGCFSLICALAAGSAALRQLAHERRRA